MTEFLSIFITWQFLVLCVGIAAITFVIRTTIEFFILNNPRMPGNSQSKFWREFFLVILPIVLGFLFAIFGNSFPYPEPILDPYSKFLFGSAAGLLSPTLYRVIKALFWKTAGGEPIMPQPPFPYNPQPPYGPQPPYNPQPPYGPQPYQPIPYPDPNHANIFPSNSNDDLRIDEPLKISRNTKI